MWCSVDVTIWQHENRNVYFSQQRSCALTAQSAKPHVCVWIRVFCSFWIRDFSATTDENIIGNHLGSSLSVGIIRERRKKTTTTISWAHMVNPHPPLYWWCTSFNLSAWKSPLRLRCMVHLSAVVRENFLRFFFFFFAMMHFDMNAPFGNGPGPLQVISTGWNRDVSHQVGLMYLISALQEEAQRKPNTPSTWGSWVYDGRSLVMV